MKPRYLAPYLTALALSACGGGGGGTSSTSADNGSGQSTGGTTDTSSSLSLQAQIGQQMFVDATLSASGQMSCSTCHDPNNAYAPANTLAVQLGGPNLDAPGRRAVPSLRYKDSTPVYKEGADAVNADGTSTGIPVGGFDWDGRANTIAEQAAGPLTASFEMANTPAGVVAAIKKSAYAAQFQQAYGSAIFDDVDAAFTAALNALQAYQTEDTSFHPYSSKYDLYIDNKIGGTLTAAEQRGLQAFLDPSKGNCAACHFQGAGFDGAVAVFSDFSYEAIGVPRNSAIPANQDPSYYDLGICGPLRQDELDPTTSNAMHCGMFKVPTLRNVATRSAFFHNGVITSLRQAVEFYATRDTNPEIWYPTEGGTVLNPGDPGYKTDFPTFGLITTQYTGGSVHKYDDLPVQYTQPQTFDALGMVTGGNLDTQMPLDGRAAGASRVLSEQDVSDIVCFLQTLTDGYVSPASGGTTQTSCVN